MTNQSIAPILPRGKANAIPTRDLLEVTGYRTKRQLQKRIAAERAAGALILSSTSGGYYLPAGGAEGRQEIVEYKRTLSARAFSTLRTLKAARQALAVLDEQEVIE